jgi:hypothetical protein
MLTITIHNDLIDEFDETAVLGLGSPDNAVLGAIPIHIMTITDDDDPPEISFFVPNQIVSEEVGTFTTSLMLSEISAKTITVPYSISGTTTTGDYHINDPSPLTIFPGSKTVDINMIIMEGDGMEEDETLILTLGSPDNASVGAIGEQTILITESSLEPTVYFATSNQSTIEGDLILDVLVQMSNAWSADVSIPFTVSGTATAGVDEDFQVESSPLVIPVGYTQGSIQVQIQDDELVEDSESVVITMGTITNGVKGSPDVHTIQISDDESTPEVNFSGSNISKSETAGTFSIAVNINSPSVHDVSIPLLYSGSAIQGDDYTAPSALLTIPAGSTNNTFNITVMDDLIYDPDEQIIIDLGEPTNAELGSNSRYIVTIEDNELPLCEVGTHMLTVGTDAITWSVTNQGEALIFSGGSITWPEASSNSPRLTDILFSGVTVFSGSEKPPSFSYFAWENFSELDTTTVTYYFDSVLGSGSHTLVGNFQNAADGTTCTLTEIYNNP